MRTHIGALPIDVTRPESAKFRRPLLLLHGLWTGGWLWEPFATYLAHRGWESWAPILTRVPPAEVPDVLERVVRALPAVPILVAHDIGAVAAAACAARVAAPALVAIAPVVSPADAGGRRGFFAWPQFWRARLGGARVHPPRGASGRALLARASPWRGRLEVETGARFRAVAAGALRLPDALAAPGFVLGGAHDAIAPAGVLDALAARYGWERRTYSGRGHFAILEPGWETLADDVHRWIVRTIGAELLAFLDEDDEPDPL
jgi:non-heme chloroperoxidase